jgi:hypothetical protein
MIISALTTIQVTDVMNECARILFFAHRKQRMRQDDIREAHSSARTLSIHSDPECQYLDEDRHYASIKDTDNFKWCHILHSADGKFTARLEG